MLRPWRTAAARFRFCQGALRRRPTRVGHTNWQEKKRNWFSASVSNDSIDSNFFDGRFPKKIRGQLTFATGPQYQQGHLKVGIEIAAWAILERMSQPRFRNFLPAAVML